MLYSGKTGVTAYRNTSVPKGATHNVIFVRRAIHPVINSFARSHMPVCKVFSSGRITGDF